MKRPGRGARRVGLVLIVVALALGVGGLLFRVAETRAASDEAELLTAPGTVTMDLDRGEHGIWVQDNQALNFYDVTIEGPDGDVAYAPYGMFGSSATLRADGQAYRMDGEFDVDASGSHTITFERRADVEGVEIAELDVAVGPDDEFALPVPTAIAWLAGFVLLGIGALVGFIGLLLGISNRDAAPPPPGGIAPGGAPPPPPAGTAF